MLEQFYRHLFPARYRVLGRVLPPLSLWHLAALEAIDSPLISSEGDQPIELGDLQSAVQVCLTRWPRQPQLSPSLRHWWQQFRHRKDLRYLKRHAEAFRAYLQMHCTPPELWQDEGKPRLITAPLVLSRVAGLAALPGFTLDAIWNDVTPGYALWILAANAERQNPDAVRFCRPEDDDDELLEDLTVKTEEEIYQLAVREMGQENADIWFARRQKAIKEGTLPTT